MDTAQYLCLTMKLGVFGSINLSRAGALATLSHTEKPFEAMYKHISSYVKKEMARIILSTGTCLDLTLAEWAELWARLELAKKK